MMTKTDGRLRRSGTTKQALIGAYKAFLAEGTIPSSAQVAARAERTQRTLFNQFPTMDALIRAVVESLPEGDPLRARAQVASLGDRGNAALFAVVDAAVAVADRGCERYSEPRTCLSFQVAGTPCAPCALSRVVTALEPVDA